MNARLPFLPHLSSGSQAHLQSASSLSADTKASAFPGGLPLFLKEGLAGFTLACATHRCLSMAWHMPCSSSFLILHGSFLLLASPHKVKACGMDPPRQESETKVKIGESFHLFYCPLCFPRSLQVTIRATCAAPAVSSTLS